MKLSIDVDCTPLEARSFLGLPDLTPVHDQYVEMLTGAMSGAGGSEQYEAMIRAFSPMGDAGMNLFRQMMELGTGAMASPKK